MDSKARVCLTIMGIAFLAGTLTFGAAVYQKVIATETHLYIASVITLVFLASYAGYLYHSRPQYPSGARGY